ncbi:hypothetical protein cyc_05447 [Cyclospora cayetanensis]|uniref:Ku domain-containing protein n=1 Tax=Cyclospora cayetanensis TaxID=88456 RepID=A0A1D3CXI7_9EIME|nr:hypothetical protein cyc_05447 [Cyclospora cayetanensis]
MTSSTTFVSCLLMDVGERACASGCFHPLSQACLSLLSNRFAADPKHVAAVVAYGSSTTHNPLAAAYAEAKQYLHIEVLRNFLPIDWQLISELGKALKPGGQPGDLLDACIVATDLYQKAYAKQIEQKKVRGTRHIETQTNTQQLGRIMRVVDGCGPESFVADGDAGVVRQYMRDAGIYAIRIFAGGKPASRDSEGGFFDSEIYLPDFVNLCRLYVPVRAKRTVAKARMPLQLSPSVGVAVSVYILAKQEPLPPLRKRLKVCPPPSREGLMEGGPRGEGRHRAPQYVALTSERFFCRVDDPEQQPVAAVCKSEAIEEVEGDDSAEGRVDYRPTKAAGTPAVESIAYAVPLGKDLIPVSAFEVNAHLALKTEKGIVLLGVLPIAKIKRWWFSGSSEVVVASEGDATSGVAVSALFWACVRLDCALLCRYTGRPNSLPRPALLIPRLCCQQNWKEAVLSGLQSQTIQQAFCLALLPFADDVASTVHPMPPPSHPAEVAAMKSLIGRLSLCPRIRPDASRTALSRDAPSGVSASPPAGQAPFFGSGSLQTPSCHGSSVCKHIHPLCCPLSAYPAAEDPPFSTNANPSFLPKSSRAFGELGTLLNPLLIPNPTMQRFLRLVADKIQAVAAAGLQQQDEQRGFPQQQQSGYRTGYEELLRAMDDLLEATAFTPEEAAAPTAAAAGADSRPKGSINPVRDFEVMLASRETNLTKKRAITEMQQIILELLGRADEQETAADATEASGVVKFQQQQQVCGGMASRYLVRAMMCMEALRSGCVREREGKLFNGFLRQLQQLARPEQSDAAASGETQPTPTGVRLFWDVFLSERKLPLITTEEDPHAEVAPHDAICIYTPAPTVQL